MTEPSRLIDQFVAAATCAEPTADFAQGLALLLTGHSLTLLNFIQHLGPILTADDVTSRLVALRCLDETLAATENGVLSEQDVDVLLQFVSAKLEDEKLTAYTLSTLTTLASSENFLPHVNNNLVSILNMLTRLYEPRKHLAKVRYEAFLLLEALFAHHSHAIGAISDFAESFVIALIHVASGEKDPRNLLLSFRLNRQINERIPFEERSVNKTHDTLLSDLFDVCFCYFPISFSTPENDPYKITANDLKTELRLTIASQPQFGQDVFPSLFEKLTSTNPTVRNDVLQCLLLCTQNYSVSVLDQYWISIWDALKYELLHNDVLAFKPETDYFVPEKYESLEDSDDTKTLYLTVLVLYTLALRLNGSDSFDRLVTTVFENLESNYNPFVGKKSRPAVLLLCAMSSSSVPFFSAVVDKLFSFEIWGSYIRSDYQQKEHSKQEKEDVDVDVALTVSKQRDLVDNLGFVLTAQKLLGADSLFQYKDHLLIFLGQLLQTSSSIEKSLKCKVIQQLTKMVAFKNFLSPEEVSLALTWFSDNINTLLDTNINTDSDVLLAEITKGLATVMAQGPGDMPHVPIASVVSIVLPPLLEKITRPDLLAVINQICLNYQFLEVLSIRYLSMLADTTDEELCTNLIESLVYCFNQAQKVRPFLTTSWYGKFFPRFLSAVVNNFPENAVVLELSGKLLGLVVRYCDKAKHEQILREMIQIFSQNANLPEFSVDFSLSVPSAKTTLFKHILVNIDRGCTLPAEKTHGLISQIIEVVPTIDSEFVKLEYLQLLSLLVNKFTPTNDDQTSAALTGLFEEGQENTGKFEMAIWMAKGLLVRVAPLGLTFLEWLLSALSTSGDLQYCRLVSRSFAVLTSELDIYVNEGIATTKTISGVKNLNVRMLYKQQIFERTAPVLIENYISTETNSKKEIYLRTLSILILNVSSKVIKPHLQAVMPLVLNGLYSQNTCILEASLQTLETALTETPELVRPHLENNIKTLINLGTRRTLSNGKTINTEKIRLLSLDCLLGIFAAYGRSNISVFQLPLTQLLAPGLDDKRRSVRKKTTDVCQALHELGR